MVAVAGTATHVGSTASRFTVTPGAGAAIGAPLLSKRTTMSEPKLALSATVVAVMLSAAVVVAAVVAVFQFVAVAVSVAGPGFRPNTVALPELAPAGMVTVGV